MKQGTANHTSSGQKREPISHTVSPTAVSRLGNHIGNMTDCGPVRVTHVPLYTGRGIQAPMVGTTIHKKGSQS